MEQDTSMNRRGFLRGAAGAAALALAPGVLTACGSSAAATPAAGTSAQGSAAPAQVKSRGKIKLGFIALTDCASVVMAHELGLYAKHGVDVEVVKQASWAATRDNLLNGDIQAAHCLFGMPFSVYTGVGGTAGKELPVAMNLNVNGQAITLAKDMCGSVGFKQMGQVRPAVDGLRSKKEATFAMTFPGGTHDLWLRYWLAAAGVDQSAVKIITVPPAQMVANMKVGNMDGFCVGEPWGGVAVQDNIGFTQISTQDIWRHHPEKALVLNKEFNDQRDDEVRAVMRAVLEASVWLDNLDNRAKAAQVIGGQAYVQAPASVIDARLLGKYDLGCGYGEHVYSDDYMLYHNGGQVNFPRKSHAVWFMAQYVRFGYLKEAPDYARIANTLIKQDRYREVAREMGIAVPDDDMQPFTLQLDSMAFDPNDPAASLRNYPALAA